MTTRHHSNVRCDVCGEKHDLDHIGQCNEWLVVQRKEFEIENKIIGVELRVLKEQLANAHGVVQALEKRAEAAEQEVHNLHDDLKEAEGAVNDLMDKLTSIRSAALDAAAKVAREWNWRISADEICQDCSNVASEEIAAAIERLKE